MKPPTAVPALLVPVLLLAACAAADPASERPAPPAPSPEPARAAMLAAAEPGPQHAELAKAVGSYRVDVRAWPGPDAPPVESRAVAHVEAILGGR